jgi:hypothetical protein
MYLKSRCPCCGCKEKADVSTVHRRLEDIEAGMSLAEAAERERLLRRSSQLSRMFQRMVNDEDRP